MTWQSRAVDGAMQGSSSTSLAAPWVGWQTAAAAAATAPARRHEAAAAAAAAAASGASRCEQGASANASNASAACPPVASTSGAVAWRAAEAALMGVEGSKKQRRRRRRRTCGPAQCSPGTRGCRCRPKCGCRGPAAAPRWWRRSQTTAAPRPRLRVWGWVRWVGWGGVVGVVGCDTCVWCGMVWRGLGGGHRRMQAGDGSRLRRARQEQLLSTVPWKQQPDGAAERDGDLHVATASFAAPPEGLRARPRCCAPPPPPSPAPRQKTRFEVSSGKE